MVKIRYALFVILVVGLFFISGCSKAECKVNSDCAASKCQTPRCADKKCTFELQNNCCGNLKKEAIEDGKPGNKCTCPQDYGKCEGVGKIQVGTREADANYLHYLCDANNECVFGVDEKDVQLQRLLDDKKFAFFELETIAEFNKPFDIKHDNFKFEFNLKDDHEDLVYPIRLTEIQLLDKEVFFGSRLINQELNRIGDKATINLPVNYQLANIEEERQLSYKIRFEYTKRIRADRNPDGTYTYKNELARDEYQKFFSSKIFFVKTGEEQ